MQKNFFSSLFLGGALCLLLALPAFAATAPEKKTPAAATEKKAPAAAKKAPAAVKKAPVKVQKGKKSDVADDSPAAVQGKLDEFARNTIASINRCVLPSSGKKEITQNSNGSYTARYIEIDPKSIATSYKPATNPGVVTYIGYMYYDEAEYTCTANSKASAAQGPFQLRRKERLTELIKYVKGKWTY